MTIYFRHIIELLTHDIYTCNETVWYFIANLLIGQLIRTTQYIILLHDATNKGNTFIYSINLSMIQAVFYVPINLIYLSPYDRNCNWFMLDAGSYIYKIVCACVCVKLSGRIITQLRSVAGLKVHYKNILFSTETTDI